MALGGIGFTMSLFIAGLVIQRRTTLLRDESGIVDVDCDEAVMLLQSTLSFFVWSISMW